MANKVTKHIPNTITCMNLFSGCLCCVMAFRHQFDYALLFIVLSAVFDFFDGLAARALDAHSIIGKDIDSLADDISFGLAPAMIVFALLEEKFVGAEGWLAYAPYAAFLIAVFSALRLAKFNNDTRQTTSFIGLPVPANALFWAALVAGMHEELLCDCCHPLILFALILLSSWLLVCELPMFSLKFKSLGLAGNKVRFLFLAVSVALLFLGIPGLALIIIWYIALSVIVWLFNKSNTQAA